MTVLEVVMCILVVAYGCVFYIAGRANLLDLVVAMIQNATKELQERIKEYDEEVKRWNGLAMQDTVKN